MPESEFIPFLTAALWNAERSMRGGAAYYIWYAGLHHIEFESAVRAVEDFKLHEQLIWVKSHFVLGRNSDYQWMHECCLYGWKEGAAHYFTDSRAESTVIEDEAVKLSTMKKGDLIALCEKLLGQNQAGSVLRADKPNAADMHPTVKPQALLVPLIRNSSKRGWNVLDLFGGSGSTLIACEQTGRRCYMMELDPHYVDVIVARWEKLTGEKAVLLN
jgi:DNA modification methylase